MKNTKSTLWAVSSDQLHFFFLAMLKAIDFCLNLLSIQRSQIKNMEKCWREKGNPIGYFVRSQPYLWNPPAGGPHVLLVRRTFNLCLRPIPSLVGPAFPFPLKEGHLMLSPFTWNPIWSSQRTSSFKRMQDGVIVRFQMRTRRIFILTSF